MIKVYNSGVIQHIFEVDREKLHIDAERVMQLVHYEVVPGSLAYIKDHKVYKFEDSFSTAYPKDDCRDPTEEELLLYEGVDVI